MKFLILLALLAQDPTTPFTEALSGFFQEWDRNSDGELDVDELDLLVDDATVTGKKAAIVASLKIVQRGDKWKLGPYTREFFTKYATAKKEGLKKEEWPNFDSMYAACLRRIQRSGSVVFAEGQPRLEDVNQGSIGDCFFLAPIGALVHRDPERVRSMIRENSDGTYTVRFGAFKTVKILPPTEIELATSSSTDKGGRWIPILEKAFATLRNGERPEEKRTDSEHDVIARGGSTANSLRTITGRTVRTFSLRAKGKTDQPPTDEEAEAKLKPLREIIRAAIADHRLICAGTPKTVATPGVNGRHAYAILGFDEKADTIRVWNPHGNTFKPKGEPGLKTGYETKDGLFTIPLKDFVRIYGGVSYEE